MMIKRTILMLAAALCACLFGTTALAGGILPYQNYNYSEHDGRILPAPQAYTPVEVLYGHSLGIAEFDSPADAHADEEGTLFLLDSAAGRIVAVNPDMTLKREIKGFRNGGKTDEFTGSRGLYVDDAYIYIADTERKRIVILDKNGELVRVVNEPKSAMLGKEFIFKPIKVATDPDRLLYIIGEGIFEGIITMDWDGNFAGFVGSNNVKPSAWDIFWMQYSTLEQRQKMIRFVPQDFSSIDVDDKGFFFCTTYTSTKKENQMVKRLNPGGENVIRSLSKTALIGDPRAVANGPLKGKSSFVDVACKNDGIYACLDLTRGKVFVYNHDGYMLYNFGAISQQDGGFSKPVALTWMKDDKIAVVDRDRNSVTIFAPTAYAVKIHEGIAAQEALRHEEAGEKWKEVLKLNSNYELAHIEVGKVYQNTGSYQKAMEEFRQGGSDALYSKAFAKYRAEWIYRNIAGLLTALAAVAVLILAAVFAIRRLRRKQGRKGR